MISVNSALKIWRTFYCEGKWHECARYKLSLEGKPVTPNLLPNGKLLDMDVSETGSDTKPATPAEKMAPAVSVAQKPAVTGPTTSYYLRMQIKPATGVMSEIIRTLGEQRIRIDAVTEKKGYTPDAPSYLIVLTDQTAKTALDDAVGALSKLTSVIGNVKVIELEAMTDGRLG